VETGFEVNPNAMVVVGGRVYAGTLGRGLYVYDRAGAHGRFVTAGLPSANVTALAARDGVLYIGTDNGLVKVAEGDVAP
jgi:ligand-binding sensor domain-containing protein